MSALGPVRVREAVRPRWDAGSVGLRLLVLVLPLVALWSTLPIGAVPGVWAVPTTVAAALLWAVWPGSSAGAFALGIPVLWWATGPADGMSPWALLAAAALLGAHVAAHVLATGPSQRRFDAAYTRRWALRTLLVLPVAPVVYAVAAAGLDGPSPAWVWGAGLAAACLLFAAAQAGLRTSPGRSQGGSGS